MRELRYTGEWPPVDVLQRFPNWEYALDEEEEDGQDETTIRPCAEQSEIGEEVVFTLGVAVLASGEEFLALLEVDESTLGAVNVFERTDIPWRLVHGVGGRAWEPYVEDWLPVAERCPRVELSDGRVFPLDVRSRLGRSSDGEPFQVRIPR